MTEKEKKSQNSRSEIDFTAMFIPLLLVIAICIWLVICQEDAMNVVNQMRQCIGNQFGWFYMLLGLSVFLLTMYIAFSKYGKIKLGKCEKPQYTNFQWGTMIFTSTMAADILYYSCIEWALYAGEDRITKLGDIQLWSSTYPLFHWGVIPWGFYIILAIAFGFMLHVRGRNIQKFSEGCRPILGKHTDGLAGRIIDLFAIFALLAGTATTFSLATPLLSEAICDVFHMKASGTITIAVLLVIALIYTIAVLTGFQGIMHVAKICVYLFLLLTVWVFLTGGETVYIIETGITAIGNMAQHFIELATFMDPLRSTGDGVNGFVQNWTIFYWAYWLVWCVATPFFIGLISKGRTIKQVILGGYCAGIAGTFTSFIVLGNYGLAQQMRGKIDILSYLSDGGTIPGAIIKIFNTLPGATAVLLLLVVVMITFYATTFDSLTMVISIYSYKHLEEGKEPGRKVKAFWAILFIIFPIGLLLDEKSMNSLQSISIIAALPIGLILILIVVSFLKDIRGYEKEREEAKEVTEHIIKK